MKGAARLVAVAALTVTSIGVAAPLRSKAPAATPAMVPAPVETQRPPPAGPLALPVLAVAGDVFAQSVVRGLDDRDTPEAGWRVSDQTTDALSLNGDEAGDPDRLIARLQRQGPIDAAVLMLGREDDIPPRDARGPGLVVGSPEWRARYGGRIKAIAAAFRDRHIPLLWIGLPIVHDPAQAQRYAALNAVIRENATAAGATFADAWQAFTDDNGDYTATGPDMNGRPALLRWTNGWNLTRAGALKLASFVLPDLKRMRDRVRATEALAGVANANPDTFDQALSIDINALIRREAGLPALPAPMAPKPAGPLVALTAAPMADNGLLLPLPAHPRAVSGSGETETPHPGRADDFTWPRP